MLKLRVLVAALGLLLPIAAFAQVNATVSGTASDATGALIPGVEVTATNVNTGIVATQVTNETGAYQFGSLQPGTYRVSGALSSFKTQTYENVLLSQGQQVRLNFTLDVAGVGQTVEVTVDADTTLATTSSSVGDVLPVQEVQNLPLAIRDVLGLINATAGTSGRDFGGQGTRALNLTRDGLVINDTRYGTAAQNTTFVSSDLVEEVKVVIGNIDAESGRGSGQVSLQTRSGTNQFHGALFETNQNSGLAASDYFANLKATPKNYTNRNQFGGRLGGPILKNKAFFFILVDEQRWLQRDNFVATVLTQQARNGIFRYINGKQNGNALAATRSVDLNGNILDPANLRSFDLYKDVADPFRTAPSTNAYWRYVMSQMPLPNDYTVGDGLNTAGFRWTRPIYGFGGGNTVGNNNNRDQLNLRFDYQLNSTNKFTVTTTREYDCCTDMTEISDWPNVGFRGTNEYFPHLYTTAWTSTLSPSVLNEFRFGYKETHFERRAAFQNGCCLTDKTFSDRNEEAQKAYDLLPKSNGYVLFPLPSGFSFASATGNPASNLLKHGFDTTRGQKSPTQMFSDTISWTKGVHSFKAGFETVKGWSNGWNTTSEQIPTALFGDGNFPVSGITSTRFPGLNSTDATNAIAVLNDLSASVKGLTFGRVINSPTQATWDDLLTDPRRFRHLTERDWDVFFKDNWNVTKNLTLNLGVRYDKYGVLYDQKGMIARAKGGQNALFNYLTNGTLTESELVGPNSTNPNEKFWKDDWNNIGPSLGFSYKVPWFDRTTVIRGGYGINYAGAPVVLDYENDFGNSPGSADVYLPATPFVPTTYTSLDTATSPGSAVLPLPAKTQPGVIIIPLTDKTQVMNTPTDNHATPYIQSFNLSVQHDLTNGLTLQVSYIGNKGTKLFSKYSVDEPNLLATANGETLLQAFNVTRAGGESALFNRLLNGLAVPSVGTVNGTTLTGSQAFRRWAASRVFLANGTVSDFARFVSTNSALDVPGAGKVAGNLLTNAGLPQSFITASPQFSDAQIWGTEQNSTYHSMQAELRKAFSRGLTGQFTYTWSKALGNTTGGETGATTIDPNNHSLNKGRLSFDSTHVFTAHGSWELPFGTGKALLGGAPKWADRVVGGWQLATIFNYSTGSPLTITGNKTVGVISNTGLPDLVGAFPKSSGSVNKGDGFVEFFPGLSAQKAPTAGLYGADPNGLAALNTNFNVVDSSGNVILTNAAPGVVGNLGQRWIDGPRSIQMDLSLAKKMQIRENLAFTIRADAINAPNLTNWGSPNVNINSANFGRITALATGQTGRQYTLSGRVDF